MSDQPTGAKRYGTGGGDAYYDAVRFGGYEGTREQFGKDQAEFAENALAVAEAKETVVAAEQHVVQIEETFTNETVPAATELIENKGTEQVQLVGEKGDEAAQAIAVVGNEQTERVTHEGDTQVAEVQEAGSDASDAIGQAKEDAIEDVEQAGETQVGLVDAAGTTNVEAVNSAGSNQVQRVQDKGDEVLASIPADYTELDQDVDNLESALNTINGYIASEDEVDNIPLTMHKYWGVSIPYQQLRTDYGGGFFLSSPISVQEGECYLVTGEGYGTTAAYAFGYNGTIVSTYPTAVVSGSTINYAIDRLIVIPSGINEIYVSNTTQGQTTHEKLLKINNKYLRYRTQTLTDDEKEIARSNINATSFDDFLDIAQRNFADFSITPTIDRLINNNGIVAEYSSTSADYYVSNALDVSDKKVINVTGSANYYNCICVFYDSADAVVEIALKSGKIKTTKR